MRYLWKLYHNLNTKYENLLSAYKDIYHLAFAVLIKKQANKIKNYFTLAETIHFHPNLCSRVHLKIHNLHNSNNIRIAQLDLFVSMMEHIS